MSRFNGSYFMVGDMVKATKLARESDLRYSSGVLKAVVVSIKPDKKFVIRILSHQNSYYNYEEVTVYMKHYMSFSQDE